MDLKKLLCVAPEVLAAVRSGKPVLALESALLLGGETAAVRTEEARQTLEAVHAAGAVPAVCAVVNGVLRVGLSEGQLHTLARAPLPRAGRRDLPVLVATGQTALATAGAAMVLASLAGIPVAAAGRVGGVRLTPQGWMHASADLQELRQTPVAVVCAGLRPGANAAATLDYLETMGVPVLGLGTDTFPATADDTAARIDYNAPDAAAAAAISRAKWNLGLKGGVLLCTHAPEEADLCVHTARAAAQLAAALSAH